MEGITRRIYQIKGSDKQAPDLFKEGDARGKSKDKF